MKCQRKRSPTWACLATRSTSGSPHHLDARVGEGVICAGEAYFVAATTGRGPANLRADALVVRPDLGGQLRRCRQ